MNLDLPSLLVQLNRPRAMRIRTVTNLRKKAKLVSSRGKDEGEKLSLRKIDHVDSFKAAVKGNASRNSGGCPQRILLADCDGRLIRYYLKRGLSCVHTAERLS